MNDTAPQPPEPARVPLGERAKATLTETIEKISNRYPNDMQREEVKDFLTAVAIAIRSTNWRRERKDMDERERAV